VGLTEQAPDATPLDETELIGLIPTWIATREDLNLAEQTNIEEATRWAFSGRRRVDPIDLLRTDFVDRVHVRMFGRVWRWAGERRQRVTNIGVDPAHISVDIRNALDDVRYWHENASMPPSEIAVRLHHRIVSIHPYANGNGRHSRFMADYYMHTLGLPRLVWGSSDLAKTGEVRSSYIAALRAADNGEIDALLAFALDEQLQ